jgi:hypothetical protein
MIEITLPDLLLLSDYGGDYHTYMEAVYAVFEADFVKSKPEFRGKKLRLKYHPETHGKAYTFYHMTHEGNDEANRQPDLRRCERMPWARPAIENCDAWQLKVWRQVRNGKDRICIWIELAGEPDYFVVLDDRKDYILPWTAFVLQYNHEKRKKQKEYEEYLKTLKKQEPPSDA